MPVGLIDVRIITERADQIGRSDSCELSHNEFGFDLSLEFDRPYTPKY